MLYMNSLTIYIVTDEFEKRIPHNTNDDIKKWSEKNKPCTTKIVCLEYAITLLYSTRNISIIKSYNETKNKLLLKFYIMYNFGNCVINNISTPCKINRELDKYISNDYLYTKNKHDVFWLNKISELMNGTVFTELLINECNLHNLHNLHNFFSKYVLDNYYFYPCLIFNSIKTKYSETTIEDLVKNNMLVFNTDVCGSYYILPLTSLNYYYTSEYQGTFISKLFYIRDISDPIPKIIHQIWIGNKSPPKILMDRVREFNPNCKYIFWDETLIKSVFPLLLDSPLITRCKDIRGKADVIRLYVLEKYGGIYLDADIYQIKQIPEECYKHNLFVAFEDERMGAFICNGIIGCTKNNKCISHMIEYISKYSNEIYKLNTCLFYYGPGFFTYFLNLFSYYEPFIYPSYYWFKYKRDYKYENKFLIEHSITTHFGNEDVRMKIINDNELEYIEFLYWFMFFNKFDSIKIIGNLLHYVPSYVYGKYDVKIYCDDLEKEIQKTLFNIDKTYDIKDYDKSDLVHVCIISAESWTYNIDVNCKYLFVNNSCYINNISKYTLRYVTKALHANIKYDVYTLNELNDA